MHGLGHDINILFAILKGMFKVFERPKVEKINQIFEKDMHIGQNLSANLTIKFKTPCKLCTSRFHLNHLRKVLRQRLIWLITAKVFVIKNCWLRLR